MLLVPAHPGCPGQKGCKTVVIVVVVVVVKIASHFGCVILWNISHYSGQQHPIARFCATLYRCSQLGAENTMSKDNHSIFPVQSVAIESLTFLRIMPDAMKEDSLVCCLFLVLFTSFMLVTFLHFKFFHFLNVFISKTVIYMYNSKFRLFGWTVSHKFSGPAVPQYFVGHSYKGVDKQEKWKMASAQIYVEQGPHIC